MMTRRFVLGDDPVFIRWSEADGQLHCSWCDDCGFYLFTLCPDPTREKWLMVRTSDGYEVAGIIGDEAVAKVTVFELMLAGVLPRSNKSVVSAPPWESERGKRS